MRSVFIIRGMKTLGSRIAHYRNAAGMSQAALAKACQWSSQSRIGNYERDTREPTIADLAKIATALGVPREYLLLGEPAAAARSSGEPGAKVPLLSWVQAGDWCVDECAVDFDSALDYYPCPIPHGPNAYALRVAGVSMLNPHGTKSFSDGDIIFVDPDAPYSSGSLVVARLTDDNSATFKQLVIDEAGRMHLRALNPSWHEPIIAIESDAVLCGVVIAKLEVFS